MEIEQFDVIIENAASVVSHKYGRIIERNDIFNAIFLILHEKEGFEHLGDVWDISYSEKDILVLLEQFDFNMLEQKIEMEEVIPSGLFGRKVKIKTKGEIWFIHKNDKDPFPSDPHAHNFESNVKMDLSNGKLYRRKNYVATVPVKKFLEFRESVKKKYNGELPPLSIRNS